MRNMRTLWETREWKADGFLRFQIGYGSNRKTRHMMPSGHKAFVVNNTRDLDLLLMHNRTYAAEYVLSTSSSRVRNTSSTNIGQDRTRCLIEEEDRDCGQGEAVGCQGDERKGEDYHGIINACNGGFGSGSWRRI